MLAVSIHVLKTMVHGGPGNNYTVAAASPSVTYSAMSNPVLLVNLSLYLPFSATAATYRRSTASTPFNK